MAGGRLWTEEEDAIVRAIPRQSRDGTIDRVARELGRSRQAVVARRSERMPRAQEQRRWTPAEETELVRLRAAGMPFKAIGRRLRRTFKAASRRYHKLRGA